MLHTLLAFHQKAQTPLGILEGLCRHDLVCAIREIVAVISAAFHGHDSMSTVHLVNCIAVFIGRQLCTVHARACYRHRVHLHEGLESRELLFHYSVDHSFQLTQGDVCVQSHLLCRLCRACCHLADCHLRLANLHHTYSTVDYYCSSHHVHHCFVLSPELLGGKDTESSGFEEHTWQIRGILMKRTDSAVKRRKKPDSKEG